VFPKARLVLCYSKTPFALPSDVDGDALALSTGDILRPPQLRLMWENPRNTTSTTTPSARTGPTLPTTLSWHRPLPRAHPGVVPSNRVPPRHHPRLTHKHPHPPRPFLHRQRCKESFWAKVKTAQAVSRGSNLNRCVCPRSLILYISPFLF